MLPESLKILQKFGRARLSGDDFMKLCSLNKIVVIFSGDCRRGMYYFADGKHTIVISTRLEMSERHLVSWHEFAHFLQNFHKRKPIAAFSRVKPSKASEKLADVFSSVAVRPDLVRITGPQDFIAMIMETEIS